MELKILCILFLSFCLEEAQNDNSTSPKNDTDVASARGIGSSTCGLTTEHIKKIHVNWCDTFATKKYEDLRQYYAPGGRIELPMLEPFLADNDTSFSDFVSTVKFLTDQFNVTKCDDYETENTYAGCENSQPPAWLNGTASRDLEFFGIPMTVKGKFQNRFLDIKGEPKIVLQKFEVAGDSPLNGLLSKEK